MSQVGSDEIENMNRRYTLIAIIVSCAVVIVASLLEHSQLATGASLIAAYFFGKESEM